MNYFIYTDIRMCYGMKDKSSVKTTEHSPGELLLQATRGGETNNKRSAKMLKPDKFAKKSESYTSNTTMIWLQK